MRVGIIGLGTVGKGVYEMLQNTDIEVVRVFKRSEQGKNEYIEMANSIKEIIEDDSIDTIVELIGGKTTAFDLIESSIINGKNVVTANKAVISENMEYLTNLAEKHNVKLLYEASVGGGIIVLNPLATIAKTNEVNAIEGIVNGSTNFILTKMFKDNMSFKEGKEIAYELGYLETGSNDDLLGLDAARKITILSSICYSSFIDESHVYVKPLELTNELIAHLKEKDMFVKYIATSLKGEEVSIRVEAIAYTGTSDYSNVNEGNNLISFVGDKVGKLSFYGPGAGRYETASACVNDLFLIRDNIVPKIDFSKTNSVVNNNRRFSFLVETDTGFILRENIYETEITDFISYIRIEGDYAN